MRSSKHWKKTAILLLPLSLSASAWDGPTDNAAWALLTNNVASNEVVLATLIGQADAAGLNTDYAYVSQVVIDQFQTFAQYDRDNPSVMSNAVADWWLGPKIPNSTTYHIELPFDEMAECLAVSSNAIAELQAQLATNIVLKAPLDLSSGTMTLTNDYFALEGVPAIPSTFTWMPDEEDLKQAFGRMAGSYYQLTNLEPDGTVTPSFVTNERDDAYYQTTNNMVPQQIFLGGSVDSWMTTAHPEVVDGARNFVKYDTDSPLIRGWLTQLFEGLLPELCGPSGSADGARMHLLANEPNFATREGGWLANNGVSANTMAKYKIFLETRYTNDISYLNSTYATSYLDFDAARDGMTMPISTSLQGGPEWHDWCLFNMDRINGFFDFLKEGTQANDPGGAPATIKVLGRQFLSGRDEGMDVEYLAKLMDVQGADNKVIPLGMSNLNYKGDLSWTNRYGMQWTGQSCTLDFMRSVSPGKAFYDSEWHGLSTGRWRDFSMDPDYVRASIWMAASHGMRAMQAWYWPRDTDGSLRKGGADAMIGSIVTLPAALDSYGRTFKELNAHGQSVVSLIPETRYYMIYHCDEAAIQDADYLIELEAVYEALKLLNVPVGFVTPSTFTNLTSSVHTLIMPPAQFVSDDSLSKLQAFEGAGGNVVQVNGTAASFAKNEHGVSRGASGLSPYANVTYSPDTFSMAADLESALVALKPVLPVEVAITEGGSPAYGVLAMQSLDQATGSSTIALINLSTEPRTVALSLTSGNAADYRNLLTGQLISNTQTMQPYDVLLLKTESGVSISPPVTTTIQFNGAEGYANGDLTAHPDWTGNTGNIVNTNGAGFDGAVGIVDVSLSQWKRGVYSQGVASDSTGDWIKLSTVFQFTSTNSVGGSRDLLSLTFYDTISGNNDSIRAAVRRTAGAGLNFLIANQNANPSSVDVSSSLAGLDSDLGVSDWLKFSATLMRGATSNDWSMDLTLENMTSNSIIDTFSPVGLGSTADFFSAAELYGAFSSSRSDANISSRVMDSFSVTVAGQSGWAKYVLDYGLSGEATNDTDEDGKTDLYEYALAGNPTNALILGTAPSMTYHPDNTVRFQYLEVSNSNPGITYLAEWSDDLVSNVWNSAWDGVTNTGSATSGYYDAEYQIDGSTNDNLFFRLNISQP